MASGELKIIEGWTSLLAKRTELPPDSQEQEVIDDIAKTQDPVALPVLRKVLKATIEYRQYWESTDYKKQPGLWATVALANSIEAGLQAAIIACTPEGEQARLGEEPEVTSNIADGDATRVGTSNSTRGKSKRGFWSRLFSR